MLCDHGFGVIAEALGQVQAHGFEFIAIHAQAMVQNAVPQVGTLGEGAVADGLELRAILVLDCPSGNAQTELDVSLDLASVQRGVEQTEFHSPLGEEGMQVQSMIASVVVVAVVDAAAVVIVCTAVPDRFELGGGEVAFLRNGVLEGLADRFAVGVAARGSDVQTFEDEVLTCGEELNHALHAGRVVVCAVNVDVDAAGGICLAASSTQSADDGLEEFDVLILERRSYEFDLVQIGCVATVAFGNDGGIEDDLPLATLTVEDYASVVTGVGTMRYSAVQYASNNVSCIGASDASKFDFNAVLLILQHGVQPPFEFVVCGVVTVLYYHVYVTMSIWKYAI